ncbi:STAS domain-containing protein [Blastococcus aurantiacus]
MGLDLHVTAGRIVLTGELDRATCGHLVAACPMLVAATPAVWVVDLTDLTFCDASGLRALVALRRAAADAGAAVVLNGARPLLRRLLAFVSLSDVVAPVLPAAPTPAASSSGRPPAVHLASLDTARARSSQARSAGPAAGADARAARR